MTPPATTRDRILDAFQDIVIEHGERAATIEAVAARAGISKGGLLYHFGSKELLIDGMLRRFAGLVTTEVEAMRASPAGPVEHYIRSSVSVQDAFDRAFIAVVRLAQGSHAPAAEALQASQVEWFEVLAEATGDPAAARAITLIGDGMYYSSSMGAPAPTPAEIDALLAVIARLS